MKPFSLFSLSFAIAILLCNTNSSLLAQDIPAILAIQEIDTMLYTGAKDNRINWVIQNRGNSFTDREDFTTLYENGLLKAFELGHDLEQVPYAQYRNFFNLYTYWWPDAPDDDSGWTFGTIQGLRDAIFLPWANEETGWATFFSSTKYGGGGGAGLNRDARVGDGKMYGMGWETFLHEFGHTMPGLLDEYSASGVWSNGQCWETPNTTGKLHVDDIPWRLWIEPGTPIPTPYTAEYLDKFGAFEGAMTNYFGCHRPTARGCFMGAGGFGEDYGLELCSPCIQRVICFLYKYVNVIENALPAAEELTVTGTETISFSVDVLKPEPNTQQYKWILNGEVIATDVETVDVTFNACDTYDLVFTVLDTNTLVRYDPKFEETYPKPYRERRWTIDQSEVSSYSLASTAQVQNADCTGEANGAVDFELSGGEGPYQIYMDGLLLGNPITGLASGEYKFDIVDANGCGIIQEVTVDADPFFNPEICATFVDNAWTLGIQDTAFNYPGTDLDFAWSTGETTANIYGLSDGAYSLIVTTNLGCSREVAINLQSVESEVEADETIFPTQVSEASGKIYLDISGGKAPYTIDWYDKFNTDLTTTNTDNILASGTTWGHNPAYAFDDDINTKWLHAVSSNAYIGYQLSEEAVVNYYVITSADDVPERDPRNWQFQASNDGTNWTILDQQTDHEFTSRYQRKGFVFSNSIPFRYYRLLILGNYGDIATQLQELEIVGPDPAVDFAFNPLAADKDTRTKLAAGAYRYFIKDANRTIVANTVQVGYAEPFEALELNVVQEGDCQVRIEEPDVSHEYFWFPDGSASAILSTGTTFQPPASGNYYVAARDALTGALSTNIQGFAVTVQLTPDVEAISDTELAIVDPDPELIYYWYDEYHCGTPIHTGPVFAPQSAGYYYVSAQQPKGTASPLDPSDISGLIVRMDASDLGGDGVVDNPQLPTSSLYGWQFSNGNGWEDNNWYAYRSNYQNGLGVADFATIWLQRLAHGETGYQTIILAYEENPISFPERAPFEGLTQNIPRHSDASQLYSNSAPARTLNGSTYLNGQLVDPFTTANPLEFCILGTAMTEQAFNDVFYTDTHWEGKVGELILYDRALTPTEMEGVSAFLHEKWISVAELESPRKVLLWDGLVLDADEVPTSDPVIIFPNPTDGLFEIKGLAENAQIQLIDASGKVLKTFNTNANQLMINIENLPAGMYFVKIADEDQSNITVKKVLKM